MNPHLQHDIELLKRMVGHLDTFQAKLLDKELPHHEKQIVKAAIVELKEHIAKKTRDIKRRLREQCDY